MLNSHIWGLLLTFDLEKQIIIVCLGSSFAKLINLSLDLKNISDLKIRIF